MQNYLVYPSWISPEIIPGLPFRWYGMMYLVAFGITYILLKVQLKNKNIRNSDEIAANVISWSIVGLLLGGRLFSALFYTPSGFYWKNPWLIFWPFRGGEFVGLQGMSYHGGLVGALVGAVWYLRYTKSDVWEWSDMIVAGVPLGYTFGRIGNFINGELYGRVSTSKFAMLFPQANALPTSEPWVAEVANKVGIDYGDAAYVNLPRHASQLYEAFFEGIFLWLILWFIVKKHKKFRGAVLSAYLIGYGVVRFFIEYTRQPDSDLGYVIQFSKVDAPIELFSTLWNFSLGQIFCFLMIASGVASWFLFKRYDKNYNKRKR